MENEPLSNAEQLDLDTIEARANAATPGPWKYDGQHYEITAPQRIENYWLIISECRSAPDQICVRDEFGHQYDANYAFIAAARTDIPALVAEVKRLTEELQNAEAEAGSLREFNVRAQPQLDAAYNRGIDDAAKLAEWHRDHNRNPDVSLSSAQAQAGGIALDIRELRKP